MEKMTMTRHQELTEMLGKMQKISNDFYASAFLINCHPFLEFCGFMNEYIKLCRGALADGIDFTDTSKHRGNPLPMKVYEAAYIGEKFGCIFSSAFAGRPDLARAFLVAAEVST